MAAPIPPANDLLALLRRGLRRGGQDSRERWLAEWMPEEDRYIAAENAAARVDLVLDATG